MSYPLYYTEDIQSDTPNDPAISNVTLENWATDDSDERINVVLNLSLNEYIALSTCVDVGRDIAYGDNSLYLWWIWVRGIVSMDICNDVLDCINSNIDIQNAIQSLITGSPDIGSSPNIYNSDAINESGACDYDAVWGYCKALWLYIDQQNIDFLQQMSEATNLSESIDTLLSTIPGYRLLPIQSVLDFITNIADYNLEAYNASITTQVTEDIECALFCYAINNDCTISFADVYNIMLDFYGGANFPNLGATFSELVIFMVTGVYPSDKIVYLWTMVQLGIVFIGQSFLGVNTLSEYALHAQTGDPDNDWALLCTCVWTHTFDFTVDDGGFYSRSIGGDWTSGNVWQAGVGWTSFDSYSSSGNKARRLVALGKDFTESEVTEVSFTYNMVVGTRTYNETGLSLNDRLSGVVQSVIQLPFFDLVTGDGQTETLTATDNADMVALYVGCSNQDGANWSGSVLVTSCTVKGTGVNPFV